MMQVKSLLCMSGCVLIQSLQKAESAHFKLACYLRSVHVDILQFTPPPYCDKGKVYSHQPIKKNGSRAKWGSWTYLEVRHGKVLIHANEIKPGIRIARMVWEDLRCLQQTWRFQLQVQDHKSISKLAISTTFQSITLKTLIQMNVRKFQQLPNMRFNLQRLLQATEP